MPSRPPEGEPAPPDGALPQSSYDEIGDHPFGVYVHVPFCRTRCGYCDFNTYTAGELGSGASTVGPSSFARLAVDELRLARRVLGQLTLPAQTVFFGGGTPTLLAPADLALILAVVRDEFGLAADAEVTTEANPDSVDLQSLRALRAAGFTRVSLGMQSAVPHVLATLERTHDPDRVAASVAWAREVGFGGVSLDLIYGTPGESLADWEHSLRVAVAMGPDHVSAYALVVEEGTRLAVAVRRGELPAPDDDDLADKYLMAEEVLTAAGYGWYEVSNWARTPAQRCRHNVAYWRGDDWWGAGPGAHSHVAGTRWWNVRHPAAYAARLDAGLSPAQGREVLTAEDRRIERVLLGIRLADGHPLADVRPAGLDAAAQAVADGLLDPTAHGDGRATLTLRGRLLADAVVRDLVD